MRTITPAQTSTVERGSEGHRYLMTDYLGHYDAAGGAPQAYLVHQEARELRAHFHEVDQFQVVLAGRGSIGAHNAEPGVVHYTDGYTVYGPLRTDPAVGLSYFTLRRVSTTGINFMPEERERRRRAGSAGEHFTVAATGSALPGTGPVQLASTARGACAYAVRLGADEPLAAVARASGQGAQDGYAVVLDGAVCHDGRLLERASLVHVDHPGQLHGLRATDLGAFLVVLLFAPTTVTG